MIKPSKLRLEASSLCQLRCPSCPTTTKAIHPVVGTGFLKLDDFRKLIEENPGLREVELSNYGEIFLNPELSAIMREAFDRHVRLTANNGANLNHVGENVLEDLVKYRFKGITCSIDGASKETYIEKINQLKRKYHSIYPRLLWQFVVFGHNEHEIPAARKLAHQLQMDFYIKLSWDAKFSPVRDRGFVMKELGLSAATRKDFKQVYGVDYAQEICNQLWDQPQINWDGKVLGCCRNFWGDYGNAFADGLSNSLNNEKMEYAREMLVGKRPARADIPCTTCDIYVGMKKNQSWVERGVRGWTTRQRAKLRRYGLSDIIRYLARLIPPM